MLRTQLFKGVWGVLGNYWKAIKEIGKEVNKEPERPRRNRRGLR